MASQDLRSVNGGGSDPQPLLLMRADNSGVIIVTTLLKTINFCEKVNLYVSTAGVRFVVEEGKYVQAGLMLKAGLFKPFACSENPFGFKIPFKELLDCLKILGGEGKGYQAGSNDTSDGTVAGGGNAAGGASRSMQITYDGHGTPFCLSLEENGMSTAIELKTEEADVVTDFDEVQRLWEITMDAKLLHEHLIELDGYSADTVVFRVVPNKALELRASGTSGSLKITVPKNCTGIERFCVITAEQKARFKFNVLKYSFKLIQAADKAIIQMGDMDTLALRLVFKESMSAFGEFFMMPYADTDEDGDPVS